MHGEVGDRHRRQVLLQRLPVGPVVEGHVHPELGARVQQPRPDRVLPHHPHRVSRRDAPRAVGDPGPVGPPVLRLVDVGVPVVHPVAVGGDVRLAGLVGRGGDHVDGGVGGQARGRHVLPGLAAVAGQVHEPVVRARPQDVRRLGPLGQREDRPVHLDSRLLRLDRLPGQHLLGGVVAGEVRADPGPALPPVRRLQHVLGGVVDDAGVELRHEDGRVPLEPVLQVLRGLAEGELGIGHHVLALSGLTVHPVDVAAVATGVAQLRVVGVEGDVAALPAAHGDPLSLRGQPSGAGRPGRDADGAVVLLGPIHAVREAVVGDHPVELRRGLVVVGAPGLSVRQGDLRPAVIGDGQVVGVLRVDPEVVRVPVRDPDPGEGLAPVDRPVRARVQGVDGIRVLRVGEDVNVVERPLGEVVGVGGLPPRLAGVVRTVHAPLVDR